MLTRSPAVWLATTSWRNQLSNSSTTARRRRHHHPVAIARRGVGLAWRRAHVAIQARILELQSRRTARHTHVVGTAEYGQRMQVQAVRHAARHDVHPAVRHRQRGAHPESNSSSRAKRVTWPSIQRCSRAKVGDMPLHLVGGSIRRETAGIIRCGPAPAGSVIVPQLPALAQQLRIEDRRASTRHGCRVDARRKEAV